MRASATAARTESEFVALLRAEGLVVRFGGDLTLPALRQAWKPHPEATAAWRAVDPASRAAERAVGQSAAAPTRAPRTTASPEVLTEAAARVQQVTAQLGAVPLHGHAAWSALARDTAGVLSALSQRVGGPEGLGLVKAAHT